MGNSSSSGTTRLEAEGVYDADASRAMLEHLGTTGRYYTLPKPDGEEAHVIGVVPGSEWSEQEAAHLIRAVQPKTVYLDIPEYDLEEVEEEAAAEAKNPWRPPDRPPLMRTDWELGINMSMLRHKEALDRIVFRMCGVDVRGPWRAALQSSKAVGAEVIPFPVSKHRNYDDYNLAHLRLGSIQAEAFGNNMMWSDTLTLNMSVFPSTKVVLSDSVRMPSAGYFSTVTVDEIRDRLQRILKNALASRTAEEWDVESFMNEDIIRLSTLAAADTVPAEETASVASSETAESASAPSSPPSSESDPPVASPSADERSGGAKEEMSPDAAKHQLQLLKMNKDMLDTQSRVAVHQLRNAEGSVVGVIDVARLGAILRRWDEPISPDEVFRDRSWGTWALFVGSPSLLGGTALYGGYRFIRRFPKTGGVLSAALGGFALVAWQNMRNQGSTQFGQTMWEALARPVPPIGSSLGLGSKTRAGAR